MKIEPKAERVDRAEVPAARLSTGQLPKRLLSVEDTALFFGVDKKTILRWIKDGKLRAHKPGRHWKIAHDAIEILLASRASWQRVNVP